MWEQREHWLPNLTYATKVYDQQGIQDLRVAMLDKANGWVKAAATKADVRNGEQELQDASSFLNGWVEYA